jgi:hypothetical protein
LGVATVPARSTLKVRRLIMAAFLPVGGYFLRPIVARMRRRRNHLVRRRRRLENATGKLLADDRLFVAVWRAS